MLRSPHVEGIQDSLMDSGPHAVDCGFRVLDSSLCQCKLDSGFRSLVRFRIP